MIDKKKRIAFFRSPGFYLLLIALTIWLLYFSSLDLLPFADDFAMWHTVAQADTPMELLTDTYNPEFYRPLEQLLIRLSLTSKSHSYAFYHAFTIAGHIATAILIYLLAIELGLSVPVSLFASLFFGISHVNAMAVLGLDSAGQVYATLFGILSFLLLLRQISSMAAALSLLIALFWKDAALSFALGAGIILLWKQRANFKIGPFLISLAPFIAVVAISWSIRYLVGIEPPQFGQNGRYQVWFGLNIPLNLIYMVGAMVTPVGTTILLLHRYNPLVLIVAVPLVLSILAAITVGVLLFLKRGNRRSSRLVLPALLLISLLFPNCLINQVSELYVYKANTLFSILLAGSLARIYFWSLKRSKWRARAVSIFILAILACNVISTKHKEHLMRSNGQNAAWMLRQIKQQVPIVPPGTEIFVTNLDKGPGIIYSVFYMHGVWVLGNGEFYESMYGRQLVRYKYVDPADLDKTLAGLKCRALVISYNRGKVNANLVPSNSMDK